MQSTLPILSARSLFGADVVAVDGSAGRLADLVFDDESWEIRYLIVSRRGWLPTPRSTIDAGAARVEGDVITVHRTVAAIRRGERAGPPPTARQLHRASGLAPMLGTVGTLGTMPIPPPAPAPETRLRSAREVIGYWIDGVDGNLGHVEDLAVDAGLGRVVHIVLDTLNWLPGGRKAVLPPQKTAYVDWTHATVSVDLPQDSVERLADA